MMTTHSAEGGDGTGKEVIANKIQVGEEPWYNWHTTGVIGGVNLDNDKFLFQRQQTTRPEDLALYHHL